MNKITLKKTGTQSSIYFCHSRSSVKWPEKQNTELLMFHFKLVHFIFQQCRPNNRNSFKHWIFSKI